MGSCGPGYIISLAFKYQTPIRIQEFVTLLEYRAVFLVQQIMNHLSCIKYFINNIFLLITFFEILNEFCSNRHTFERNTRLTL